MTLQGSHVNMYSLLRNDTCKNYFIVSYSGALLMKLFNGSTKLL